MPSPMRGKVARRKDVYKRQGKSFAANLELAYNNAHAASKIAVAYTKL